MNSTSSKTYSDLNSGVVLLTESEGRNTTLSPVITGFNYLESGVTGMHVTNHRASLRYYVYKGGRELFQKDAESGDFNAVVKYPVAVGGEFKVYAKDFVAGAPEYDLGSYNYDDAPQYSTIVEDISMAPSGKLEIKLKPQHLNYYIELRVRNSLFAALHRGGGYARSVDREEASDGTLLYRARTAFVGSLEFSLVAQYMGVYYEIYSRVISDIPRQPMPDLKDLVHSVWIDRGFGANYTARIGLRSPDWSKYKLVAKLDDKNFWDLTQGVYNGHGGGGYVAQASYGVEVVRNHAYNGMMLSISVELFGELHELFRKNTSELLVASADAQV